MPSTARTTPSSVKKYVFSPLTSRSRSTMACPLARYHRLVTSPSASSARSMSSASMSLCVTQRIEVGPIRSEEHTSELQSRSDLVCRLLLEKKKKHVQYILD